MKRIAKLRQRKIAPEDLSEQRLFSKSAAEAVGSSESYQWLVDATEPIEEKYTNKTFDEGDRVRDQLLNNLGASYSAEFEYQGSVTNNTHVRYHSDIDLLVLHGVYLTFPAGHPVQFPVTNEVVVDALGVLRKDCSTILKEKFPRASVDDSKSKAVSISGGSLERDVDVVVCNWWHTPQYLGNKVRANLGIYVLDVDTGDRVGNMPFLHNWFIDNKDSKVDGSLRKAIRLLKNLKYDKEPTEAVISSYDITALAYNMPEVELIVPPGAYLKLAKNVQSFLGKCVDDTVFREALYVPNGTRKIFGNGGATLTALKEIKSELDLLIGEIAAERTAYIIELSESVGGFQKSAGWSENRPRRVEAMASKFAQADS